jgi:hypothetical protein
MAPLSTGGATVTVSRLINRNVVAERGRTSMRLEPELWDSSSHFTRPGGFRGCCHGERLILSLA